MSNSLKTRYDIIINGGGIVGFTLLNLLKECPLLRRCKVLLIEQAKKPSSLKQPPRAQESSTASGWDSSASDSPSDKSFSNRVSSITLASRRALGKINAWDPIRQYTKDVRHIKVWNYDYSDKIVFEQVFQLNKEERDVMFSVVENNRLSLALMDAISQQPEARDSVAWNSSLINLERSPNGRLVDVTLKNLSSDEEYQVSAPLVVGCDGFKSKVRELAELKYREVDLNKTAVVGTVRMASNADPDSCMKNDIAYQRFSWEKDTVAALLPLDNEHSSFVISAPNDYANHLMNCDEETFTNEFNRFLNQAEAPSFVGLKLFHDLANFTIDGLHNVKAAALSRVASRPMVSPDFGGFEEPPQIESMIKDSRALFPLYFGTTSPKMIASVPGSTGSQLVLLGDSAHRVHPLAGQGLNLGIQDAVELVRQLHKVARCGGDILDEIALEKALKNYETKRQQYIIPMSAGILSMPYLFKLLPTSVVSLINKCDPIKNGSVRFANGC